MFKKKEKEQTENVSRKVVTETVERHGGVQTTQTTVTCSADNLDKALRKLQLDPVKFQTGGTLVTRQIVYTNSSGVREVLEETVEESFADPKKQNVSWEDKTQTPVESSSSPAIADKDQVGVKPGEFENDCLRKHNEYRKKHGVPMLTLSPEICAYAKEWADHLAETDSFEHRRERKYGENIFMKWSSNPNHTVTGEEAVESWYSEIKDYTFGKEPTTLKSGHFTQVIWKGSQKMGVAWSRSKTGKILVVANYDPAGNFIGKFRDNVPPPNEMKK